MANPVRVCPYYQRPCQEARDDLHLQGKECNFITRMIKSVPSRIHGAPPTEQITDICIIRSMQQSLNALHQANDLILGRLNQITRAPMPFSKG